MDRFDYQQQLDNEEREALALQALMEVTACGLKEQADILAAECGLSRQWRATLQERRQT